MIKGAMDSSDGSDEERVDSVSAATTPIPMPGIHLIPETIRLPIVQKKDQAVFTMFTFPTIATIGAVVGELSNGTIAQTHYKIFSPYGSTSASGFDEQTPFQPGDYSLGFGFETKEIADSVVSIRITLMTEPISNLLLSQILFTFYRSLGYEPSFLMQYPVQSSVKPIPFYRKTRTELEQVSTKLNEISSKMTELVQGLVSLNNGPQLVELSTKLVEVSKALKDSEQHLTSSIQSIKPEPTITVEQIRSALVNEEKGDTVIRIEDVDKLMKERAALYDKLKEAEDYIDQLQSQKKKH